MEAREEEVVGVETGQCAEAGCYCLGGWAGVGLVLNLRLSGVAVFRLAASVSCTSLPPSLPPFLSVTDQLITT